MTLDPIPASHLVDAVRAASRRSLYFFARRVLGMRAVDAARCDAIQRGTAAPQSAREELAIKLWRDAWANPKSLPERIRWLFGGTATLGQ